MNMIDLLGSYLLEHELKPSSQKMLREVVSAYSTWLGRIATVDDLCSDTINRHLVWLQENGRKPATRQTRRRVLLTFWRFAIDLGVVDRPVRRVRTVRLPESNPEAWTEEEIRKLLDTCDKTLGFLRNGVAKRYYWRSLIMAAWDTALRLGDLLSLEYVDVKNSNGRLTIVQNKTGFAQKIVLRPETMAAIELCMGGSTDRLYIWAWPARREEFYKAFARIVKRAGIRKGTFRWLRRASTTAVEILEKGAGKKQAGHRDGKVTEKHYIDASQIHDETPLPPPLVGETIKLHNPTKLTARRPRSARIFRRKTGS